VEGGRTKVAKRKSSMERKEDIIGKKEGLRRREEKVKKTRKMCKCGRRKD
jgi:hypothetical protein